MRGSIAHGRVLIDIRGSLTLIGPKVPVLLLSSSLSTLPKQQLCCYWFMANCLFSAIGDGCIIETLVDEESQERSDSINKDFGARNVGNRKCYDWRSTAIILGFEFFESLCLYGISTNLVIYLTKVIHESNTAAATIVANWTGTNFLTPLLVALFADSYLGNYKTILFSSIIYIIGALIVTFSATVQGPKAFICKRNSPTTGFQKHTLFIGLYLIAFGSGGVKSSLLPLGADQFDDNNPTQQVKKASFFTWFYCCINLGALVSSTLTVWIKENVSWSVGYGIASVCMALATASFLLGTPTFRPGKLKIDAREDINCLHEVEGSYSPVATDDEFRFLDKGAELSLLATEGTNFASTSRLRRSAPLAQLKSLVVLFPIWLTNILYSMAYAQIYTTFVEQGRVMYKKIGSLTIPPASLVAFQVLGSMFCVLFCDKILLVTVRRFLGNGHGLTHLQRMGVGHFLMILAMAIAAVLESKRLENAAGDKAISILWQLPQFFVVGCSEVFCYAGQLEFFYDQGPNSMRSISTALSLLTVALGNYLNSLMLTVIEHIMSNAKSAGWIPDDLNKGHLDEFFWLLAGICFVNFVAYLYCASRYMYRSS